MTMLCDDSDISASVSSLERQRQLNLMQLGWINKLFSFQSKTFIDIPVECPMSQSLMALNQGKTFQKYSYLNYDY